MYILLHVDLSKDNCVKSISKDATSPVKGNSTNDSGVVIANMTTEDKSYLPESYTDSTVL